MALWFVGCHDHMNYLKLSYLAIVVTPLLHAANAHVLMREEYLSSTLFVYGHHRIKASDEYLQTALRLLPGWSIAAGVGLSHPDDFNYLLLDAHGNASLTGGELDCLPAFQVGFAHYTDNQSYQSQDGLLLGLSASCPINAFASLDVATKRLRGSGDSSRIYNFVSVGFKFKL